MFATEFRRYVFENNQRRHRDDRLSLMIAFGFTILMFVASGSERFAGLAGLVVLAICTICFAIYACNHASEIAVETTNRGAGKYAFLYQPVTRRGALLSGAALAVLAALPGAASAALDKRLRQLTARGSFDEKSIKGIAGVFRDASVFGAKLDAHLAIPAISAGSAAASASTVNLELPVEMQSKMFDSFPEAKGSTWVFTPIATNTGPDNYSLIGFARQPDVARMEHINAPFTTFSTFGPAFLVTKGLTADLDGYRLKNVVFQDMHLIYHGGPLILENVYFYRCELQFDSTAAGWRLISAITSARGWVSFSDFASEVK